MKRIITARIVSGTLLVTSLLSACASQVAPAVQPSTPDPVAEQLQTFADAYFASRQALVGQGRSFSDSLGGPDADLWRSAGVYAGEIVTDDAVLQRVRVPDSLRDSFAQVMAADQALVDALRYLASHQMHQTPVVVSAVAEAAGNAVQAANAFTTSLSFEMGLHGVEESPTPTMAVPFPS